MGFIHKSFNADLTGSETGIKGRRSWFSIMPRSASTALIPPGLPSAYIDQQLIEQDSRFHQPFCDPRLQLVHLI